MRQPSLRSQLNQIRLWVRQGRTDAWIAHKLDISVEQLEQFKREHLSRPEPPPEPPREAPREAAPAPSQEPEPPEDEEADEGEAGEAEPATEPAEPVAEGAERPRRRRRGRRGGRRRTGARPATSYEATFDHGSEGYGLWLDPAVAESQVYADHWAGQRAVTVTLEADAITIRRAGGDSGPDEEEEAEPLEP